MTKVAITPVGRSVATSGLRPASAHFLLDYAASNANALGALAKAQADVGQSDAEREDLEFALIHTVLASPEYAGRDEGGRRYLPWQISGQRDSPRARRLQSLLVVRPWETAAPTANAADIACDWIAGTPLRTLEDRFADLRGGSLRAFYRDTAQILFGWAGIISASVAPSLHANQRPAAFAHPDGIREAARTVSSIARVTALRMEFGLPTEALWMAQVVSDDGRRILPKEQIMALVRGGFIAPSDLLDTGRTKNSIELLKLVVGATTAADVFRRIRAGVESYRRQVSQSARDSQLRRLRENCRPFADAYYETVGTQFEDALNAIFGCLGIRVVERDEPRKHSFPDFVLDIPDSGIIVIECKTTDSSVDLNAATDVIRKAALHGYDDAFKVTICKPYMSPDVGRKLSKCPKLAVVNAESVGEVLVRLANGRGTATDFGDWCSQSAFITADTFQFARRIVARV